jgi:hypothetical protein
VAHVGLQIPATHAVAVAFSFEQAWPQPPQLFTSADVSTSQPFFGSPSQSAWCASHCGLHKPATQEALDAPDLLQTVAHEPQ